jgi:hypothetical protein
MGRFRRGEGRTGAKRRKRRRASMTSALKERTRSSAPETTITARDAPARCGCATRWSKHRGIPDQRSEDGEQYPRRPQRRPGRCDTPVVVLRMGIGLQAREEASPQTASAPSASAAAKVRPSTMPLEATTKPIFRRHASRPAAQTRRGSSPKADRLNLHFPVSLGSIGGRLAIRCFRQVSACKPKLESRFSVDISDQSE